VRLPELERFRVGELQGEPDIDVRIGRVKRSRRAERALAKRTGAELNGHGALNGASASGHSANGHGSANGASASGHSANGHASTNGHSTNGHSANGHAAVNGASVNGAHAHQLRYSEGPGRLGFGVEITELADRRIAVTAAPLLRHSPHVLYTNVVEPILRWTFVGRGYALVHAACFADGERAFLITARTDTGKTTTTLKTLDRHPYSFVSDDLTIVCPDGRVLTYPKPLTISRHTVQAVRTPLLTRRERFGLIFQSRLHSRNGRRFAMLIAKLRIPAATLNAVVQFLVPPPKYHVERLIPTAQIAPEANLTGLVVIQRGGLGDEALERDEALEILLANCEDAYGFPPYGEIEGFLHSRGGHDLKAAERRIIEDALSGIPATLLRSETMDWWERMPGVVGERKQ
jgi:hypothetical protein